MFLAKFAEEPFKMVEGIIGLITHLKMAMEPTKNRAHRRINSLNHWDCHVWRPAHKAHVPWAGIVLPYTGSPHGRVGGRRVVGEGRVEKAPGPSSTKVYTTLTKVYTTLLY